MKEEAVEGLLIWGGEPKEWSGGLIGQEGWNPEHEELGGRLGRFVYKTVRRI
jgi:hypothetical protein